MLSRKLREQKGSEIPPVWVKNAIELLNENFANDKKQRAQYEFQIFGEIYDDEIILAVSWIHSENNNVIPTTFHSSCDINTNSKPEKVLDILLEATANFFDTFFAQDHFLDYSTKFESESFKNTEVFYKITRENIGLSYLADKILNQ